MESEADVRWSEEARLSVDLKQNVPSIARSQKTWVPALVSTWKWSLSLWSIAPDVLPFHPSVRRPEILAWQWYYGIGGNRKLNGLERDVQPFWEEFKWNLRNSGTLIFSWNVIFEIISVKKDRKMGSERESQREKGRWTAMHLSTRSIS